VSRRHEQATARASSSRPCTEDGVRTLRRTAATAVGTGSRRSTSRTSARRSGPRSTAAAASSVESTIVAHRPLPAAPSAYGVGTQLHTCLAHGARPFAVPRRQPAGMQFRCPHGPECAIIPQRGGLRTCWSGRRRTMIQIKRSRPFHRTPRTRASTSATGRLHGRRVLCPACPHGAWPIVDARRTLRS